MTIKAYNIMAKRKEEFVPIMPMEVKMYVCGPTVYNYFHIGNARTFIVFDTIRKYFEYRGYKVKFIQNFTDIDDKMIRRANEEGITVREVADKYIKEYYKDADDLLIDRATVNPRAEFMSEIIAFAKELEEARKDKNFTLADEIRNKLKDQGIVLEDTALGVKWKRI